jgi:K+-transporting ATPase KdpF subunit
MWYSGFCSSTFAGHSPKPATVSKKGTAMDYVIAGIAGLFLFGYLVYALLRPEKF